MKLDKKNIKKIVIFAVIPILISVSFFTNDLILKIIIAVITTIYIGFIIFLRNSLKADKIIDEKAINEYTPKSTEYEFQDEFKVVKKQKTIETLTSDDDLSSTILGKKEFFKPHDLKENYDSIVKEEIPGEFTYDEQFMFVLDKILTVLKDAFLAHSALFFWYNDQTKKISLGKYVSSSAENVVSQKFDMEDDILSKIIQKQEPEILSNISPTAEKDVIRYYDKEIGIKSFIGVPFFHEKKLYGILAADSKTEDSFGIETIYSLGRFVRVFSIILSLFSDKFDETLAEKRLKAVLGILGSDKNLESQDNLNEIIGRTFRNIFNWDAFAFIAFNKVEKKFYASRVINNTSSLRYIGEGLEIDLTNTLVGKAVISGLPVRIDDTSSESYVRYSNAENISFEGTFLALPLIYEDQNYGVLCFECLKKRCINNSDIKFLMNASKIFAFIIHSSATNSVLQELIDVDAETMTLNKRAFKERVNCELQKCSQLSVPSVLALIKIDDFLDQGSFFETNPLKKIIFTIVGVIREDIKSIDLLARCDEKVFGVYFFNTQLNDVILWAEKLRTKIARKPIAVASKQTTFTVSIGIASAYNKNDFETIIDAANLALKKAVEKGGNSVKSIA
ncbi:MAG: GAF domain-containing protein [Ignavibacteriales bacterium]|nr:GAF domain-containing protein [Ignavibacteriales bacterium]